MTSHPYDVTEDSGEFPRAVMGLSHPHNRKHIFAPKPLQYCSHVRGGGYIGMSYTVGKLLKRSKECNCIFCNTNGPWDGIEGLSVKVKLGVKDDLGDKRVEW